MLRRIQERFVRESPFGPVIARGSGKSFPSNAAKDEGASIRAPATNASGYFKSPASGVGDGKNNRAKRGGFAALQGSGHHLKGCSGGHHVVDDQYISIFKIGVVAQSKGVVQVLHALGAGVQMRLRIGVTDANHRTDQR